MNSKNRLLVLIVCVSSVLGVSVPQDKQNLTVISERDFNDNNSDNNCGQIFTKKQFIIESPLYPSNYPLNYQCSYLIKGPTCPTYFNIEFLDFNLENSLGCTKDRLEIENQDALCGNKNGNKTYFSHKGTLILKLVSDKNISGRGYRLLVTRLPCMTKSDQTTRQPDWYTTNKDAEYTTKTTTSTISPRSFNNNPNQVNCCRSYYNSKQIVLVSPNLPYSMSTATSCQYEIHKANRNVCRLRIHVQFFYLGQPSENCPEGYLQIDGKYICGCKTDLKLISPFQGDSPKIIKFVSGGYERNSYSGFVLEIIQDECPKRYTPENTSEAQNETFKYYNDQINRVSWPSRKNFNISEQEAMIERLKLISENTEIIPENNGDGIVKHVYFFSGPDFNYNRNGRRDREEVTYIDTSSTKNVILQDSFNDHRYCINWNKRQFQMLSYQNLEVCKSQNEGTSVSKECVDLGYQRGYFKSPGYPFYYPGNLNICYRFKKLPGYCSITLYMKDFNIENSINCAKDYLMLGTRGKYCGSRLSNTVLNLDLSGKNYEDVSFLSDAFYCGRGFFGTYEQIACQDMTFPINPTLPPHTPTRQCQETVQDRVFALEVFDYSGPVCEFTIKKYSRLVCKVELYFEKFDLVCASESLVVDGTMHCGHLTGQRIVINVGEQDPVLVYRRISNEGVAGPRFRIRGTQSDDCFYPEVPAERLSSGRSFNETESQDDSKYFIRLINNQFKDLCGVITNSTDISLPDTFCDILMKNASVTKCIALRENSIFVPLDSHRIELKIPDVEKTQEIEFEEIDCDDIS